MQHYICGDREENIYRRNYQIKLYNYLSVYFIHFKPLPNMHAHALVSFVRIEAADYIKFDIPTSKGPFPRPGWLTCMDIYGK